MPEESLATQDRGVADCGVCRRCVLVGEPLTPFHDPRAERTVPVCELCRGRAQARGWTAAGAPVRRGGATRLRVEHVARVEPVVAPDDAEGAPSAVPVRTPERAVLERVTGLVPEPRHTAAASSALVARIKAQDLELDRLRRELDPARRAEQQRQLDRQAAEVRELRASLAERDRRIEQLARARQAETSPMRMSGYALDAFNQSSDLERMARIARTLGAPAVNVHDEGPGIPRRVRITLSWDIAWYEFMVKLDLGANRASVHETGTGGDPSRLPIERRRANAAWSDSGLTLS